MKIKKRYFLNKKKLRAIKEDLGDYSIIISPKSKVEMVEAEPNDIILVDGAPHIMLIDNKPYPTLKAGLTLELDKKYVIVDAGAVRFMVNGADVMSPGIVEADSEIKPDDVVFILDEQHHKPLAVGISLITGNEMVDADSGKAIKSLHFVGDDIWNMEF